jgi:hypothetical protein
LGVEAANGSFEVLYPLIKGKLGEKAWYSGEFENIFLAMGLRKLTDWKIGRKHGED